MPATETMNIPRTGVAHIDRLLLVSSRLPGSSRLGRGGTMKDVRSKVAVRLLAAASSITAIVLVVGAGVKF